MTKFFNIDVRKRWEMRRAIVNFRHLLIPLLMAFVAATVGETTWELMIYTFHLIRLQFVHLMDSRILCMIFDGKSRRQEKSFQRRFLHTSHA